MKHWVLVVAVRVSAPMQLRTRDSPLKVHARALGCKREGDLIGLCVNCPYQETCGVPRTRFALWVVRVNVIAHKVDATPYLNELASADIQQFSQRIIGLGVDTKREGAIQMRCGDVLYSASPVDTPGSMAPCYSLWNHFKRPACRQHVVVARGQVRYIQISNFGRRSVLAVQCCSRTCADKLALYMETNWSSTMALIRRIRPLKDVKPKVIKPEP